MKFSHTMDISGKIKKALLALSIVLFAGQLSLQAQASEAAMRRLIDIGKYNEAISMGNTLLASDPKNDKVEYLMGLAYFETERYNEADAWFVKGQGHSGRNAYNFVGTGAVAAHAENFDKAKLNLDKAVELNSKQDPKVFLAIANAYMGNPNKDKNKQQPYWSQAELFLYKVQKLSPNDAESYVLLGKLYGLQGVTELEQSMYEKAIELDPKYIYGYFRLGQLFKKQGKYQEAYEKFKKVTEIDPGFGPVYKEMAEMWILAKKYDLAEENIKKYKDLMGSDKTSRIIEVIIYYLGEQYEKVISLGEPLLQDTNATVVKRLLGYSYVKRATPDADKSLSWFDAYWKATSGQPGSIIATDYELYGKAFQLKGNFEEASKNYEKAVEKSKENGGEMNYELYNVMSEMYKEKKDTLNRIVYLRKYIQSQPKYTLKENFTLGQTYWQMKDYVHADSVFDVMTQKMPDLHIGWSWRGRTAASMDPDSKQGKAMPYYQKVLDLIGNDQEKIAKYKSDYTTALRYFGAYHTVVVENCTEAVKYWQKILELMPEDANAKNGMEYCKGK